MKMRNTVPVLLLSGWLVLPGSVAPGDAYRPGRPGPTPVERADSELLLDTLTQELQRSCEALGDSTEIPLYYLGYGLTDIIETRLGASLGAMGTDASVRNRFVDVDVRVGSPEFDNTRESRTLGNYYWQEDTRAPLDDDPLALRITLWRRTDRAYKDAQERYANLRTEANQESLREDASGDFSSAPPAQVHQPLAEADIDLDAWRDRLRDYSAIFLAHPAILNSRVELVVTTTDRYLVNSEGSRVVTSSANVRLVIYGWTKADDGMELYLYEIHDKSATSELPPHDRIVEEINTLIANLEALRKAPVVDPFTGPAILQNRAAGVFIHEIFGHRVEGHRQKSEQEGQTFTAKVGERIMPEFLDVYDDPTLAFYGSEDLKGHYVVDDEGVPAERADLVVDGVLEGFLMSRSPVEGFPVSNGHGRREHGYRAVSRQGNLVVESSAQRSYDELREALIAQLRRDAQPYGLIFTDISGGFTLTGRALPQSFKVEPLLVYRVYADGRPDELVRGVDLVGTPLTTLGKIVAAGDDPAVFDGYCGAESGNIPVSAVAPSLLISEIEVEKKIRSAVALPVLEPPALEPSPATRHADPVLGALHDELTRTMSDLQLPESAGPYHLNYRLLDQETWQARASFGALSMDQHNRVRYLTTTVRVGEASFDNTQFVGTSKGPWRPDLMTLPLEDSYAAVRHGAWLGTDRAYKEAVAHLAAKQAFVRNTVIPDRPADFSASDVAVLVDENEPEALDRETWRSRLKRVSALFRESGVLEEGLVNLREERAIRRILDSDGAVVKAPFASFELIVSVQALASDGRRLSDYRIWRTRVPEDLPTEADLIQESEALISEMTALLAAPEGEPYVGPVLLVDQAAAEFFAQILGGELANPRAPLIEEEAFMRFYDNSGALSNRLNRRILPTTFQVVDDPTRVTWGGTHLLGYYRVDDEGVEAQRLELIRDGWLRELPLSRTPTRELAASNGHGRSLPGLPAQGKPSSLLIHTSTPVPLEDLYDSLRELTRLSQIPYGIVITRLHVPAAQSRVDREGLVQQRLNDALLASPLVAFRLYEEDGRLEPVRGHRFEEMGVRALKDIVDASSREQLVQTVLEGDLGGGVPISIIAPDILLEEAVLTPGSGRRFQPPFLPRPRPEQPR